VIAAAVAHLWFVTIHPFEDGNGRIGRAIADMALTRADGLARRFYSLSAQLMSERKDYYQELEAVQGGGLDVTCWVQWFLGCLSRAIARADDVVGNVLQRARIWAQAEMHPAVNDRQRLVLELLMGDFKGHLTSSKYAKLAKCSTDTALRDIERLVERGLLLRNPGGGRNTSYRLAGAIES
jgi:Fic family protein